MILLVVVILYLHAIANAKKTAMETVQQNILFDTIESAIEDIKQGKVIIIVDDEDRENEGDFVCAAECITPEIINFMATHGRGLICTPITEERAKELELTMMVDKNTDLHGTAFTISVDYKLEGCTTGISTYDRATGIKALLNKDTKPEHFARPGHIFPLIAKKGGVLRRTGHTEAAVDLAQMAGLEPAGVLVEILNQDGTMARLPQLKEIAKKFDLKIISIKDIVAYRVQRERLVQKSKSFFLETVFGPFEFITYSESNSSNTHLALKLGDWEDGEAIPVRVHSSDDINHLVAMMIKGYKGKISNVLNLIQEFGKGLLIFIRHNSVSDTLEDTLSFLDSQSKSQVRLNPHKRNLHNDINKEIGIGSQILLDQKASKIRLITNNPGSISGINGYGIEVIDHIPLD